MFERFTRDARQVVVDAREWARELRHRVVGTEHLLLALAGQEFGAGALLRDAGVTREAVRARLAVVRGPGAVISDADAAALESIGIDVATVRARLEASFGYGALDLGEPAAPRGLFGRGRPGGIFAPRAKKVLELSLREALRLRHNAIGSEHLLLGILREGQGLAVRIMVDTGADLQALRRSAEESFRRAA